MTENEFLLTIWNFSSQSCQAKKVTRIDQFIVSNIFLFNIKFLKLRSKKCVQTVTENWYLDD